jgi:hypothetical protein
LEAAAFGGADDINECAFSEPVDCQHVTDFELGAGFGPKFTQLGDGLGESSLFEVAEFRGGHPVLFLDPKTNLDGVIAIIINGFYLSDRARASLDNGDGNQSVLAVVNLGHAHLFAEED